jgi:predicted choloylglycine hydrolase
MPRRAFEVKRVNSSGREIRLCGGSYEMGLQHGTILRNEIQALLNDSLVRVNLIRATAIPLETARDYAWRCADWISRQLPTIWDEIRGLSDGAQIDLVDAVVLQMRRELSLIWDTGIPVGLDCTTFAIHQDNQGLMAQTVDLGGNVGELARIFFVNPSDEHPAAVMYSFVGLLGYVGINQHGLAVGINMLLDGQTTTGIPPYLISRALLNSRNIDEAIELLHVLQPASARAFVLSDSQKSAIVELTPSSVSVQFDRTVFHTNHFLCDQLLDSERSDPFSLRISKGRLERIRSLVQGQQRTGRLSTEDALNILADHDKFPFGICSHRVGADLRKPISVAAIAFDCGRKALSARIGYPCCTVSDTFTIEGHA